MWFLVYFLSSAFILTNELVSSCKKSEFTCNSEQCVGADKFCNGFGDCEDQSDEPLGCTPCNRTYYGEVGRTYELEVKRPDEKRIPFLCFLNFTAGGRNFGELVQISFESFSVGTFESFTSEGCPEGYISIREANRPAPGGKWCGSAWGYTVYYSETPSVNLTLHLEKLSQQQGTGYTFEFRISYKFLRVSDAKIRYGNSTQRSYRGKLHSGTYCDRLLEGCSRRPCKIQSPNYPGIYPRNVSCHYRIRERNVPPGKHALVAVRQANHHYKEHVTKFDNSDRVFRIWDQCNVMQDYLEILDGGDEDAAMLAHLCSGETIPEIVSSGPELLVKFHTSPFGNPFHPLPLSYLPGFELEVQVFYVNKESPTYIENGKKCEFVLTTFDKTSGYLESPLNSLPPNTTCHYHFRGHPQEVVWISFIKYHITNERLSDFDTSQCDIQLQLWDGDIKSKTNVPLMGQFCKEDKPKMCDHSLLSNSTRKTRPCDLSESYVTTGSDLTITQSIKYGNVLYPVHFVLRYEFVDFSQEGLQNSINPCDRILNKASGKFYSPKITFLYGRGGQKFLNCAYHFESNDKQKLEITFDKLTFKKQDCTTSLDKETNRYKCFYENDEKLAQLRIFEYPWNQVEILRDCFCENFTQPITIQTKTAKKVIVKFSISNMDINDDYNNYEFEATYDFLPQNENGCLNPWKTRRLKGSSGEITVRNSLQKQIENNNQTNSYCTQQPWLIEPENSYNNFIYLKVKGLELKNKTDCLTKNRILVYPVGNTDDIHIICPIINNSNNVVELFSEGWGLFTYRNVQIKNSRSFVIEFIQHEPGNFVVTWMEVSKNPALTLPRSLLMISPPNCPHSCPELGACISPELWCDGLRHCPSGNDEEEINCTIQNGFPNSTLTAVMLLAIIVTLILLTSGVSVCFWRHRRREKKNVIVTVTEHTFLEFKSGLC